MSDRSASAIGHRRGKRGPMARPKLFTEDLYLRLPQGTRERIERLRGEERQGDFVRRVLLGALADLEAGRWQPPPEASPKPDGE